jgi:hypothetical protein
VNEVTGTPLVSPPRVALLRLQLKPNVLTAPDVDGAWWPQSLSLEAELPGLIAAVSDRLGKVALVLYQVDAWDEAPEELTVGAEPVQLDGFASTGAHTLDVIGSGGRRMTLLVVPPDAAPPSALRQLMDAADPGHTDAIVAGAVSRALDEVTRLLVRHEGTDNKRRTAEISGWVHETAEQFSEAPVQIYVPILVEHIVRAHILATRTTLTQQ